MQQVELTLEVTPEIAELLSDIKSVMDVYITGGTIRSLFTGEKTKDVDMVVGLGFVGGILKSKVPGYTRG